MSKRMCDDCARFECGLVAQIQGIPCDCKCHKERTSTKLTKKMFREILNKRHEKKVETEQKRLNTLPKDFVQREMDRTMGNGAYHARKRKQGDYLYFQDREMFDNLFEEEKEGIEKELNDALEKEGVQDE